MLRTMSLRVASWFRFMVAGAWTSTVTATDCLPDRKAVDGGAG